MGHNEAALKEQKKFSFCFAFSLLCAANNVEQQKKEPFDVETKSFFLFSLIAQSLSYFCLETFFHLFQISASLTGLPRGGVNRNVRRCFGLSQARLAYSMP
jgi:hypothetical protein